MRTIIREFLDVHHKTYFGILLYSFALLKKKINFIKSVRIINNINRNK